MIVGPYRVDIRTTIRVRSSNDPTFPWSDVRKSSSNGAVTGSWPGSFSGRIFLKRPTGLRPGPGGSRSGRTLGLDQDRPPLFQSPGIAPRPRRYPDMAIVAHDFHAITSSLASF
jgi:hypothetical protein